MLIDTHVHLNDPRYKGEVDEIINSFPRDNLLKVICVGYDRVSSVLAYEQSKKYNNVYAGIGIHPHDSKNINEDDYTYFKSIATDRKVVAYGEIGLDFYYDHSERDVQEKAFIEQLHIANECSLPVILHVRDAYQKAYDILREYRGLLNNSGVMHCYSGSAEMVKQYVDLGLYISFSGVITFKNSKKEDVVKAVPLDRLLVETDCPYLSPAPYRGSKNYPKYVNCVAEQIKVWLPSVDIEEVTTRNSYCLFPKLKN